MSFNVSKIHWINDNIDQFVAQNRRTMEEPKEVLTFKQCQLVFVFFIMSVA